MSEAEVYEAVKAGTPYRDIATQLGKTEPAVRAMAGRYARRNGLLSATKARDAKPAPEPAPALAVVAARPSPLLTDIQFVDPDTDQGVFLERLHAARAAGGYASVMHLCDIHAPYQHAPALDVTYQLVQHVQPQFAVVGSDYFDFSSLSSFPQDADDVERDDALDMLEAPWNAHIHALVKASPKTTPVFILGNHERRIWDFINRQAPQVRKTVWRRFTEIIRCGGRVLWLGEVDAVRFGPLRVMHGNRHNVHVATSLLQDAGFQLHVMAGHVHRLTFANRRGEDFPVSAVTSGCLCHYPAPYMKRKTPTQRWMLGTAIAEVNLRGRDVHIDNLEYQMDGSAVWARFERKTFSASIPAPLGLLTFEDWSAAHLKAA